jgi:hypothetical protein
MRGALRFAPISAALLVAGAHAEPSASPGAPPESAPIASVPAEEHRCEELARRLEALFSQHEARAAEDIALAEAQEIALVADELRAEGDLPSAETLLEEAIALLEGAGPSL